MIIKLFAFILATITLCGGNLSLAVAAVQIMALRSSPELQPDRSQNGLASVPVSLSHPSSRTPLDLKRGNSPRAYRVHDDGRSQDQLSPSIDAANERAQQSPVDQPRQQLVAQLTQKAKNATTQPDRGNSDDQLSQELSLARASLQQANQRIDELERQLADGSLEAAKRRIGELVIQLHAKESEIAALRSNAHENSKKLREDLAAQAEELSQAKRRVAEVEQQMGATAKGQELAQAKRRIAEAEQQLTKKEQELALAKRRTAEAEQQTTGKDQELGQAKRRVTDLEQQVGAKEYESAQARRRANEFEQQMVGKDQELAQAKRRVTDLEQQVAGKAQEPAQARRRVAELEQQVTGKEQELAQAKRRVAELEQQMAGKAQDPAQAKRRVTELEQQMSAREQELAQTKRRVAELEQQAAGKDQDPAQIKRRVTDLEQQMVGKEQELAQVRDNLKQVTQKYADLGPLLMDRDAELARMKQSLEDLERSFPKPEEALPSLEVSAAVKNPPSELSPDANLSVSDLPLPNPSHGDGADAASIDLIKAGETLSSRLGDEIKRGSVALRQERHTLTLTLASSELFAPDDATITPGGNSLIGQIGAVLQKFRYRSIEVITHTDNKPIRNDPKKMFRDSLELSRARVEQASQLLINSGVDADRVKPVVYTATKPSAPHDTTESRNKNRRIEIVVSSFETIGQATHGRAQPSKKSPQSISLSSPRRP